MPSFGTLDHYVQGTSFTNYVERLEHLSSFNGWTEENKKSVLIALTGSVVYDELKLIFPTVELATLKYEDMVKKLKERFDKVDPDMMQRFYFYNRFQKVDESAESFILSVKMQAELCNFQQFKETAIRDRLIMGLHDRELQKSLLMSETLTLDVIEKKLLSSELAKKQTKAMSSEYRKEEVHSVKNRLGKKYGESSREYNRDKPYRGRITYGNDRRVSFRNRSPSEARNSSGYTNAICNYCKKRGHLRRDCYSLRNRNNVHHVEKEEKDSSYDFKRSTGGCNSSGDESDGMECLMISSVNRLHEPCLIKVKVQNCLLEMEIDSGSAVSVISEANCRRYFKGIPMCSSSRQLVVVDGARLKILGEIYVQVELNGRVAQQKLVVLKCSNIFVPLIGRSWLDCFFPGWRSCFTNTALVNSLNEKTDFSEPIVGYEGELVLKHEQPIFKKAYTVPYKLKDKLAQHLEMLEQQKVITPIKASEWASPVIVVVKKDQDIRLVIDCKVSINKAIVPNTYPLPLAQDIFASLAGCKVFCCLDLAGAYTQVPLSERSKKFTVINTMKGLFTYNRLPQGASSSAAIFQQIMDQVLRGLEGVSCYLDDVLIAAETVGKCVNILDSVLERLSQANIKVNFKKCKFFVTQLPYLGHLVTDKGLSPSPKKISTISQAKAPTNVAELRAFLGLINFYNKFVPNLSSRLRSLYALLANNANFDWTDDCEEAFQFSKNALLNADLLEFYDPNKPLIVVSDASSYGLGGVLAHECNEIEKPICFTSFSLNSAQKRYPILHLEALALVCTIKKFHKFLFGQKFKVYTDHKPLVGIFGKSGSNSLFVTRLQRYIMELSIYDFEIAYRASKHMGNADFCSRFPLKQTVPKSLDIGNINSLNFTDAFPLDFALISRESEKDVCLAEVMRFVGNEWPENIPSLFKDFYSIRTDLEVVKGCLLYQDRVIIPKILRTDVVKLLHANHIGIVKMKQLARQTVFWSGMNMDIENFVKKCEACIKMGTVPVKPEHSKWIPTSRPFSRLHADFFHFEGKTFLLIVDSYSKWVEIEVMLHGTEAKRVINSLMTLFARFGLPDVMVTDGGPPFNSREFASFLEKHGVKVMKSPPYNPSSNGQAERLVRVVKDAFKKYLLDPQLRQLDLNSKIIFFLINYRGQIATADGGPPSHKVLSYKPKILLDLMNPKKEYKQFLDNRIHTDIPIVSPSKPDPFSKLVAGDLLYYKNYKKTDPQRWIEVKFVKQISKNVFQISLHRTTIMAHRNQLKLAHSQVRSSLVLLPEVNPRKRRRTESGDFHGYTVSEAEEEPFLGFPEVMNDLNTTRTKQQETSDSLIMTRSRARKVRRKFEHSEFDDKQARSAFDSQ
ncbi:uncharacterized protein K02A2.6-like isoform X2 [Toxorhynchites rutilus septentrionalis]|uniref:uncharacterized protein K02A2.6-like isoform X2 n=1 Tax=Toxorhynchites rutilus septentrionalis TaxID=329112 RepID=UPI00247841A8|nr:uncharacterized protein K02A2.6-like isoform X2 [Toxorhynchites rutilus septentrionalis]